MKKYIERLHFITHDLEALSHVQQAQLACESGAKWIQYRCLTKDDEALLSDIHAIAEICDDWGATLIVTDHIHLKGKADIQGFHVEDPGADFSALRIKLGEEVTLGGSAHGVEGLIRLYREGADYAGMGPFQHTTTKPNTMPLLGVAGYRDAMLTMAVQAPDFPVLAVGGVNIIDVKALMDAGVFGIAASAAINQAADFREAYSAFYDQLVDY